MADPAAVRAAFNALSPQPTTQADALSRLGALSTTITVDVPVQALAGYLGTAGKLASFLAWASAPPAGSSAASITAASELAFAFEHPTLFPVFKMTDATVSAQMEAWLTDLVTPGAGIAGPIMAADQTAILALSQQTVAQFPSIHNGDLQNAGIQLP